jgi:Flp pilus assembly pilin Flp
MSCLTGVKPAWWGIVMISKFVAVLRDEQGFTAIEYGLIAACVMIAVSQLAASL